MPTTPRYRTRAATFAFDRPLAIHLAIGDCLLAGPGPHRRSCLCGLRDGSGELVAELAQHLWAKHRKAVMAEHKGKGLFACFAEAVFDQKPLPDKLDPAWDDRTRGLFAVVQAEVSRALGR